MTRPDGDRDRDRAKEMLRRYSVKVADEPIYKLASGGMSRFYVDVKKTAHYMDAQHSLGYLLAKQVKEFGHVDAVAGVVLGGCHLASAAAILYGIPMNVLYVRKEPKNHGTKNLIEGPELSMGSRVVLIEDVTTTGGSSLKAVAALREADYSVLAIVTVVDRRENKEPYLDGIPIRSLFTLEELLEAQ